MKNKYDYLVVGAGLFGATFAQRMIECGKKVLVLDKRNHVAGNVYTEKIAGVHTHIYGAHIFHTNNERFGTMFIDFQSLIALPIRP